MLLPQLDVAAGPVAYHAEGPVWWAATGALRYVDMLAGDLLDLDLTDGSLRRTHVGTVAAAVRPRAGGGAVVAVERGFVLLDADGRAEPGGGVTAFDTPGVRMNEGGCDPDGAFLVGSMAYDMTPGAGSLYRLDPQGAVSVVLTDVTCSNGLAWSPDGSLAYYVDTPTRRVDVLDQTSHGLAGRRPLLVVEEGAGVPDGLTVDAEGHLWVALHGGSAVRRYRPDGALDGVVELPVSQVTACTFGGPDLDRLFVTTSRENLPPGVEPESGSVYVTSPGVRGLPPPAYAG